MKDFYKQKGMGTRKLYEANNNNKKIKNVCWLLQGYWSLGRADYLSSSDQVIPE